VKIFVTGATGVVGKRLVPQLIEADHDVTAIARTPKKRLALELKGAKPVELDLFDAAAVRRAIAGHDVVINLATHIPPSSLRMLVPGAFRENDRLRSTASSILVDASLAGGVEWFIQESFAPVYMDCGDLWIHENTSVLPSRYNYSALEAERAAHRFTERGRKGIIVRFAMFYGSDAFQTHDLMRALRYGWAPIPGNPDGYISSVSHRDSATAVAAVLGAEPGIYNVSDDEPVSRREYVNRLARELGVPRPKFPPPWTAKLLGSMGDTLSRSLRISNRKLKEECGWSPKYPSIREGWHAVIKKLQRVQESRQASREEEEA
jgi:nucleoside-diphosphate-sugar epimerase